MSLYFAACDEVTEVFSATSGRSTWRSTPSIRRESRRRTAPDRNAARMPSLHQGVLRQDGGDQVRRRRWRRTGCARRSRPTWFCSSTWGSIPSSFKGGGAEITEFMDRLGLEVEFVQTEVSNEQTVEVAKMVLVGKLNKDIVLRLNRHGQPAVGLCGDDGSLFDVRKRSCRTRTARHAISVMSVRSSEWTSTSSTTLPRTTSPSWRPSAQTARASPTTSTPTRRPAPLRPRSVHTRSSS